jgi:hypothetical protein
MIEGVVANVTAGDAVTCRYSMTVPWPVRYGKLDDGEICEAPLAAVNVSDVAADAAGNWKMPPGERYSIKQLVVLHDVGPSLSVEPLNVKVGSGVAVAVAVGLGLGGAGDGLTDGDALGAGDALAEGAALGLGDAVAAGI